MRLTQQQEAILDLTRQVQAATVVLKAMRRDVVEMWAAQKACCDAPGNLHTDRCPWRIVVNEIIDELP